MQAKVRLGMQAKGHSHPLTQLRPVALYLCELGRQSQMMKLYR